MIRKIIVSIILLCVLFTFPNNTYSVERDIRFEEIVANRLKSLNLFKGVSEYNFDLNRAPSRIEAVVMLIRTLGKENDVHSKNWDHPFKDVPVWAKNYIGYAYNNGLIKGISEYEFGTGKADCAMYLTYMLRALGYSDAADKDFDWKNPYDLAISINLLPSDVDTDNFLRADAVLISYASLNVRIKNTNQFLCIKLINDDEIFTQREFNIYYEYDLLYRKEEILEELDAVLNVPENPIIENPKEEKIIEEEKNTIENCDKNQIIQNNEILKSNISSECKESIFLIKATNTLKNTISQGTGFFINSEKIAITNSHVVENTDKVEIETYDGNKYKAYVLAEDKINDIAILYVNINKTYKYLKFCENVNINENVFAIGYPISLQVKNYTITEGKIKDINYYNNGIRYISSSAFIYNGNSGGPLVNSRCEVIGINTAVQNYNYLAIPTETIKSYIEKLAIDILIRSLPFDATYEFQPIEMKNIVSSHSSGPSFNVIYNKNQTYEFYGTLLLLEEILEVQSYSTSLENYSAAGMYYSSMAKNYGKADIVINGNFKVLRSPASGWGWVEIPIKIYDSYNNLVYSGNIDVSSESRRPGENISFTYIIKINSYLFSNQKYDVLFGI